MFVCARPSSPLTDKWLGISKNRSREYSTPLWRSQPATAALRHAAQQIPQRPRAPTFGDAQGPVDGDSSGRASQAMLQPRPAVDSPFFFSSLSLFLSPCLLLPPPDLVGRVLICIFPLDRTLAWQGFSNLNNLFWYFLKNFDSL